MSNRKTASNARRVSMPWTFSREEWANTQRAKMNARAQRRKRNRVGRTTRQRARR